MARTLRTALLLSSLVVMPTLAAAAPPTEGERLFREGRAAMQTNDYDTACARFADSQKKEPAPGTALNLGECEERRAHLVAARDAFATAASTFTAADKKGYASGRVEALDKRIPKVIVKVQGAPKSAVVHANARGAERVIEIGAETRLDPGDVTFTVEAPAARTKRVSVTLKEGAPTADVELGPLEIDSPVPIASAKPEVGAMPPKRDETPAKGSALRTAGFVIGGVGVASLVVGGVTGIVTLGKASTVKDHCPDESSCDAEGSSAASSGKTLSLVSTITVIVGIAGIGAGALLVLTNPSKKDSLSGALTIAPGPGDAGLMLKRTF